MDQKTLLLVFIFSLACAPAQQFTLVSSRQLSAASGAPEIDAVLGLGNRQISGEQFVSLKQTDSNLQIGELVYIRGRRFGKQPTVSINGRPAAVIGLAQEGGLVTRIPTGIDVGKVTVEVSNRFARGLYQTEISRLAAVLSGGVLRLVSVGREHAATRWLNSLPVPGATHIAIDALGAVAYLAGSEAGKARLWVHDLGTTPPGHRVRRRALPGSRIVALVSSRHSVRSVVVTDSHLVVIDSTEPARPAFHKPWPLADLGLQGKVRDCAISADGERLALLLSEGNRLLLFNLTDLAALGSKPFHKAKPRVAPAPMVFNALPDARLPVAAAISFARASNRLWLVSGDTHGSISGGYQPLQLTLFDVTAEPRLVRQVELQKMWAPRYLTLGAGPPRPAGTSIRQAPASDALYVAAQPSDSLKEASPSASGRIFRVYAKEATRKFSGPFVVGPVAVSGKRPVLLGLIATKTNAGWRKELYSVAPWQGQPAARQLILDDPELVSATAPIELGDLAVQP